MNKQSVLLFSFDNFIKNTLLVQVKLDPNIIIIKLFQDQLFKDLFQRDDSHTLVSFMVNNSREVCLVCPEVVDCLQ